MQELAVWRPDAFVDPDEYVAHVALGLRALRRTAQDDVRLTMTVDEERVLIELVCVRPPDSAAPALVAILTGPDQPSDDPTFPAAPSAERLADLGWDHVGPGPAHAWSLGPVAGFDAGLWSLSARVVDTLQEFACPLGFVDLRLQQPGTPTPSTGGPGGPDH